MQSATLGHCHNQAYFMSLYKADKDWEGGGLPATVGWVWVESRSCCPCPWHWL